MGQHIYAEVSGPREIAAGESGPMKGNNGNMPVNSVAVIQPEGQIAGLSI